VRAHRGRPGPTVLLAGDASDLRDLRALISTLPADAYGQVYVEVSDAEQVERLATPPRVAVTWLVRESGSEREDGSTAERGLLLAAAVEGWIAEWMPAGVRDDRRIAWVGCSALPRIADRYRVLQERSMTASAMGLPTVEVDEAE
jgi:NADPH-dependent ferric siderophore reductase